VGWPTCAAGITDTLESEGDGPPITTLIGTLDQAALQSLLRRLYSLGLPLLSVICIECDPERSVDDAPPNNNRR
jgi:hypothetical protein